jgi:hypothetical protein
MSFRMELAGLSICYYLSWYACLFHRFHSSEMEKSIIDLSISLRFSRDDGTIRHSARDDECV